MQAELVASLNAFDHQVGISIYFLRILFTQIKSLLNIVALIKFETFPAQFYFLFVYCGFTIKHHSHNTYCLQCV